MTGAAEIVVVGIDHVTGPVVIREQIVPSWDGCVAGLVSSGSAVSAVSVRTCLRAEAYLATAAPEMCVRTLAEMVSASASLSGPDVQAVLTVRRGQSGVAHLFSVAAGLESVIIGERQILNQVRNAWDSARARAPLDARIDRLFQHAVATGRRVRRDTEIGRHRASLADAAADLVAAEGPDLGGATIAVIGAGAVAHAAAVALGHCGAHRFVVVNRSLAPARALAGKLGAHGWRCEVTPWRGLAQAVAEADVIVSATSAAGYVIRSGDLGGVRRRMLVDLALPRDVDPAVAQRPATVLVDLERVWRRALAGFAPSSTQLARARAIVESRVEEYMRWIAEREAVPAITALRDGAERADPQSRADRRRALHRQTLALKRRALERAALTPEWGAARR
jgi:glutamyl-tRNA reductase